jgi:hypothetical protein
MNSNTVQPGNVVGSLAFKPIVIPEMPPKVPQLTITQEQFEKNVSVVQDNFEGGYYNPSMLPHFKPSDQKLLRSSGETYLGEDRRAGAELAKYPEWKQLWALIDADREAHPFAWKYNYRGGPLEPTLKKLVAAIMFKWFSYLSGKYILIGSMDEIANDERLMIHFAYGCWNGEKWFERYANALNKAILKYPGNKEQIFRETIRARTEAVQYINNIPTLIPNRAIRQQGEHMMSLFKRMNLI